MRLQSSLLEKIRFGGKIGEVTEPDPSGKKSKAFGAKTKQGQIHRARTQT
jgi:hypothetical protein